MRRMSKDSWTIIGVGFALAALVLQQAGSLRSDIGDIRQDVRELRGDVADVRERLAAVEAQLQCALPPPMDHTPERSPWPVR